MNVLRAVTERMERLALCFKNTRQFDTMTEAAAHFDYVINDLGFKNSKLVGDGPYYVLCAD